MRPTFAKLAFEMETRFELGTVRGDSNLTLPLPALYTPGMEWPPDCFYIVRTADLSSETKRYQALCLICLGEPADMIGLDVSALIIVKQAYEPCIVYNFVRDIFQELLDWDENLQRILNCNGSIQELLDASSQVFGNVLTVTDEDNNCIATSTTGYGNEADLPEYSLVDVLKYEKVAASLRRTSCSCYTVELREAWGIDVSFVAMFISILDNQKLIGTLCLLPYRRTIRECDSPMLNRLSAYLKKSFLNKFQVKDKQIIEGFTSLLSGEKVSREKIGALLEACHNEGRDYMRCMVIALPPKITESHHVVLRNRFDIIVPNALSMNYEDYLVVLANTTRSGYTKELVRGWLNAWLGGSVRAGISDAFTDLTGLKTYYQEAVAAFGFTDDGKNEILEFAERRLDYALANCCGGLPAPYLFPEGLRRLLELNRTSAV
ncbi:MAG: hypothetical protein FWH55_13960, partial [Oscillospiraceae bacterium]|nr:hypothetical protein [Oscillospiraceae bacterium]